MTEWEKLKISLRELLSNKIVQSFLIIIIFIMQMFLIDFSLKHFARYYISVESIAKFSGYLFTLAFSLLFFVLFFLIKKRGKLILYNVFWIFYILLFLSEYFHFKTLGRYWGSADLGLAGEAVGFVKMILPSLRLPIIMVVIILILGCVVSNILIKKGDFVNLKLKNIFVFLIIFLALRTGGYVCLGKSVPEAQWNAVFNPKNVYNNYEDYTRAIAISGTPEFFVRNIYIEIKNALFSTSNKEMKAEVDAYKEKNSYKHKDNSYTNIFKDKNVIYILLESIDTFVINKEVMPTLNSMKEEGLNFTNRYAPTFGGGKTFNTEFALLTSLYQPINGSAAFNYASNNYKYTFPMLFKEKGYNSSSIHYNTRQMYNRGNMHEAIGFDEYYGNLNSIYSGSFEYDSLLVSNDNIYNLITSKDKKGKFANFVITLSAHGDYTKSNYMCKELVPRYSELQIDGDYETSCIRAKARDTDVFLKTLKERLKKDKLLNDTVLVLATDHEMYNYTKLYEVKEESDRNLITKVPFIIWTPNIKHEDIDTLMDTSDILPTLANMFGLKFDPAFVVGNDVFSKEDNNYVFFSDYGWYDGKINYKGNSEEYNGKTLAYINKINSEIRERIKINRYILDSDYYRED